MLLEPRVFSAYRHSITVFKRNPNKPKIHKYKWLICLSKGDCAFWIKKKQNKKKINKTPGICLPGRYLKRYPSNIELFFRINTDSFKRWHNHSLLNTAVMRYFIFFLLIWWFSTEKVLNRHQNQFCFFPSLIAWFKWFSFAWGLFFR